MEEIHLGIIEDKPTIRESLVSYFEENPTIKIQLVASSVELFLEKVVEHCLAVGLERRLQGKFKGYPYRKDEREKEIRKHYVLYFFQIKGFDAALA